MYVHIQHTYTYTQQHFIRSRYLKWTSTLGRKKTKTDIWDMHTLKWDRNLSYPFKFPWWMQKREYDNLAPWRYQGSLFLLVIWKTSWNRLQEQFEDNQGHRLQNWGQAGGRVRAALPALQRESEGGAQNPGRRSRWQDATHLTGMLLFLENEAFPVKIFSRNRNLWRPNTKLGALHMLRKWSTLKLHALPSILYSNL